MSLFAVDQDEIDAVLVHPLPTATYDFDAASLRELIASAFSITFEEKLDIIDSFPTMSTYKVDRLREILTEERETFCALNAKHEKLLAEAEAQDRRRCFRVVR